MLLLGRWVAAIHPQKAYGESNVELDAVQRVGFALRAWRQVVVGGSAFRISVLKQRAWT